MTWSEWLTDEGIDPNEMPSPFENMSADEMGMMEGMYGGDPGMGMSGMPGVSGMDGSMRTLSPLQLLKQKTGKAGGAKSLSRFAMPGNYQIAPDRDLSQKPDDPNMLGIRGRHGGIMRPTTEPSGLTQPPGNVVRNTYPSLRGLQRGAQGVYNA
tara:strand:+ start:823 stop:1284 length:462 start_codon:yes stop_codon:yes gene_type:complete